MQMNKSKAITACLLATIFGNLTSLPMFAQRNSTKTMQLSAGVQILFDSSQATSLLQGDVALIKTSKGCIILELWPDVAPRTVENFKSLANTGFYDGTAFLRIVKGFMIQGGDPNTKDPSNTSNYGLGGPGYILKAEFSNRKHVRGIIRDAPGRYAGHEGWGFCACCTNKL